MILEHASPLLVVIPLMTAYSILLLGPKAWRYARVASLVSTASLVVLSLTIAYQVSHHGPVVYHFGNWEPPWGIEFLIDRISAFFLLIVSSISFLTLLFGYGILFKEIKEQVIGYYYALFLILLASLLGITSTNDLFNVFVFLEISSVSAAALVAVNGNKLAIEASVKYLVLSTLGSGWVLLAIASLYMVTGYLNLTYIASALPQAFADYPLNVLATLGLFMVGLTVKSALYPLHVWLPDAHGSAPTSSSAILSALVVKVYIIIFLKLVFRVFTLDFISLVPLQFSLLLMSTLGIFLGSLLAIRQTDIKKMLAYSTVAQIGYVFLGIGLFTYNGLMGALLHILNHAVMKAMLFLSAGLMIKLTGRRRINTLNGIGRVYPLPMIAFSLGALAMVGIPPLNGFISKWYLGLGALDGDQPFYVMVILVSSFLNGLYYLPIVINGFFGADAKLDQVHPIPIGAKIALISLSVATVAFGLFSNIVVQYLAPAVQQWFIL